jgi:uncharacterized repeat protein (TIGR01451 family)
MFFNISRSAFNDSLKGAFIAFLLAGFQSLISAQPLAKSNESVMTTKATSVKVRLDQYKVVTSENGKESLVDAPSIKPGDVIEYRATYTNQDGKPVTGLQAILPIPEGMEYLPKTARPGPGKALAATASGAFAPEPLTRQVRVNGRAQVEPVPYVQYRSLKWDLGQLAPGATQTVSARAQLESFKSALKSDSGQSASGVRQ